MNIVFWYYKGNPLRMSKANNTGEMDIMTEIAKLENVHVKEGCSVYSPTFTIKTNSLTKSGKNFFYGAQKVNYVKSSFGRPYFIKDIITNPDGTCDVICEEDVLSAFQNELKTLDVVIERKGLEPSDPFIPDPLMPVSSKPTVSVKKFNKNNVFSSTLHYVLHVAGPAGEQVGS